MYWSLILEILIIHAFAVASPGPDFLVVTKNSLNHSRTIGVWTAIGVACGIGIHVIYGIGGIAVIIKQNETLFSIIKHAGALYLLYMAFESFKSVKKRKVVSKDTKSINDLSSMTAFKNGFITNVLNPKATLFFLSIFSVIIPPSTPYYVLITIAILLILNTGLWFIIVAFLFTNPEIQKIYYRNENYVNIVFGILLILLAVKIVFF